MAPAAGLLLPRRFAPKRALDVLRLLHRPLWVVDLPAGQVAAEAASKAQSGAVAETRSRRPLHSVLEVEPRGCYAERM